MQLINVVVLYFWGMVKSLLMQSMRRLTQTFVYNSIVFGNTIIVYSSAHKTLKNTYTASKMGAASFCQLSPLSFTFIFEYLYCIFCKEIKLKQNQCLRLKWSRFQYDTKQPSCKKWSSSFLPYFLRKSNNKYVGTRDQKRKMHCFSLKLWLTRTVRDDTYPAQMICTCYA